MHTIVFGNGHLGRAIAAAIVARAEPAPTVLGRPRDGRHAAHSLADVELAFEASRPEAVADNVAAALAAGCRRFVIATTGWDGTRSAIDEVLRRYGAAAVAGPNFSLGVAAYLRIVDLAGSLLARVDGFDPYIVEWHRRGKADRPSGTAREIARRLLAVDKRKTRLAIPSAGPPAPDELEVVSVRAGACPGTHVVGFDAAGETLELRLTARDRAAYAAGALMAAEWLRRAHRAAGLHAFDEILDEVFGVAGGDVDVGSRPLQAVTGSPG